MKTPTKVSKVELGLRLIPFWSKSPRLVKTISELGKLQGIGLSTPKVTFGFAVSLDGCWQTSPRNKEGGLTGEQVHDLIAIKRIDYRPGRTIPGDHPNVLDKFPVKSRGYLFYLGNLQVYVIC